MVFAFVTVLQLATVADKCRATVYTPLDVNAASAHVLAEVSGRVFIGTGEGVWRLANAEASPERLTAITGAITFFEEIGGRVFIFTSRGVWRLADAGASPERLEAIKQQFADRPISFKEIGGRVFISTGQGVWRLADAGASPERLEAITGRGGRGNVIEKVGDHVFIGTDQGVWRLANSEASPERLEAIKGNARSVRKIGGRVFIFTGQGVWRLANAQALPERLEAIKQDFISGRISVKEIGGRVFIGTDQGVWNAEASPKRLGAITGEVTFIDEIGGRLFIGTEQEGLWRLANAQALPERLEAIKGDFAFGRPFKEIGGRVFIFTSRGVWRLADAGASPERLEAITGRGNVIEKIGDHVFIGTGEGVWRLADAGASPERLEAITGWGKVIEKVGDHVFIGGEGVWRLANAEASPERLEAIEGNARSVQKIGGRVFIRTDQGVWRLANAGASPERAEAVKGNASFVRELGRRVFIGNSTGVWRAFEAEARVDELRAPQAADWWEKSLSWLLGGRVLIGPYATPLVKYVGPEGDLIAPPDANHFQVIVEADEKKFDEKLRREEFVSVGQAQAVPTGLSETTLHIAIRDNWGNKYRHDLTYFVLPSTGTLVFLWALVLPLLGLLALTLAPYWRFCHSALMNPWARLLGSFGLVPLALTIFPPARQHLLKRYRKAVLEGDDIKGWDARFVPPEERFTAAAWSVQLKQHRRTLIVGNSGVGKTAFLRYLTACLAKGLVRPNGEGALPVYLPLGRCSEADTIEKNINDTLASLGELTDDTFIDWTIRQGGFVFLLDGLNEVNAKRREEIATFIERYGRYNWAIASSQEPYPSQFGHWGEVQTMPRLTREGIEAFVAKRVGEARASQLVSGLDAARAEMLSLPQNLELSLQLLSEGSDAAWPESEDALFGQIFERQFHAWRLANNADFVDVFTKEAYAMLRDRRPAALKEEIADPLIKAKLLRRLGDAVYFQHDTLRAYAAAEYFSANWKRLLREDGARIDSNWDTMLQFAATRLLAGRTEDVLLRGLLLELCKVNYERAGVLVNWLEKRRPGVLDAFREDFDRALGQATRAELDSARSGSPS